MEMRSHLAFLLPHGLESKEFRFGDRKSVV